MITLDIHAGNARSFYAGGSICNVIATVAMQDGYFRTLHRPFALRHGRCIAASSAPERTLGDQVNSAWRPLRRDINID